MADKNVHDRSRDEREQIHADTERDARLEPGVYGTGNEDDARRAEGLKADGKVSRSYEDAIERGADQPGEGRVVDKQ